MSEYGARMVADYKSRFGLFAVLPLPDIDASLKEIEWVWLLWNDGQVYGEPTSWDHLTWFCRLLRPGI
jgi:hypothetical protein